MCFYSVQTLHILMASWSLSDESKKKHIATETYNMGQVHVWLFPQTGLNIYNNCVAGEECKVQKKTTYWVSVCLCVKEGEIWT